MPELDESLPKPGSDEALQRGCICPVLDNAHGAGRGGDGKAFGWVWRTDCPLHRGTEDEHA